MSTTIHDVVIGILGAALFSVLWLDSLAATIRNLPYKIYQTLSGNDPYKNLYGKYFCYRLGNEGGLRTYDIVVKRSVRLTPRCTWENKETSSPKLRGKVQRHGSKYAMIFESDPKDRLASMLVVHAEGVAQSKSIKMGFQTGVLASDPSIVYSGMVILSRKQLPGVERYLSNTSFVTSSLYNDVCRSLCA